MEKKLGYLKIRRGGQHLPSNGYPECPKATMLDVSEKKNVLAQSDHLLVMGIGRT